MSRLSIAVAVALASGCGPGSETGKDEGAVDGFGSYVECPDDSHLYMEGDGVPFVTQCSGFGGGTASQTCAVMDWRIDPDGRPFVTCDPGRFLLVRWL